MVVPVWYAFAKVLVWCLQLFLNYHDSKSPLLQCQLQLLLKKRYTLNSESLKFVWGPDADFHDTASFHQSKDEAQILQESVTCSHLVSDCFVIIKAQFLHLWWSCNGHGFVFMNKLLIHTTLLVIFAHGWAFWMRRMVTSCHFTFEHGAPIRCFEFCSLSPFWQQVIKSCRSL